ncbi:hypothetical protein RGH81_000270 [Acinetobacter nosocomialis]|nr:hypothetical protein [Acinetobacter nosocomialis]
MGSIGVDRNYKNLAKENKKFLSHLNLDLKNTPKKSVVKYELFPLFVSN